MKNLKHIIIITVIVLLLIFLYDDGLGAIPFLLAAIYFIWIIIKELQSLRKSKRLQHIPAFIVYNDKYAYVQRKDVRLYEYP